MTLSRLAFVCRLDFTSASVISRIDLDVGAGAGGRSWAEISPATIRAPFSEGPEKVDPQLEPESNEYV